jgi:hypothetical protein
MHMLKSVWAAVQQDPKFMRRVNGWLTLFWIAMIPISVGMGWLTSVAYVSALSLWALVSGRDLDYCDHGASLRNGEGRSRLSIRDARSKSSPAPRRIPRTTCRSCMSESVGHYATK